MGRHPLPPRLVAGLGFWEAAAFDVMITLVRLDDLFPFLTISFMYDTKATEHDTRDRM